MRSRIRRVTVILLAAGSVSSQAAEWKIDPTMRFGAGYNDNIRMTIDDEVSSASARLSPSAEFSVETARSGLIGNLRFDFERFEDDSNLDENNIYFDTRSFHRWERSAIGLDAGVVKDTTLDSQLEDTGLVLARVNRLQLSASPSYTYFIDEGTSLRLEYGYREVDYKNAGGTGFVDFNVQSGEASLQRILNDRTSVTLSLSHSRSDNDNDVTSDNTNLQTGASYRFSETLSGSLTVGARYTETDFSQSSLVPITVGNIIIGFVPLTESVSRSGSGYTFNSGLTKDFERASTSLTASRNISTSVNGIPIEVTRVGWLNRYNISETVSVGLDLRLYNSETEDTAGSKLNRDYYLIEPQFNWNFRKFWRLSASYRYRNQTFDNTSDEAEQNRAYLTLVYQWPRIAVSR